MPMMHTDQTLIQGFESFPTTRYQGSKRRLLPWLHEKFKRLEFETVLDAFGGSASVSYLFKSMGKTVHYNDFLRSNHQSGIALVENNATRLDDSDINFLLTKGKHEYPSFIENNFRGIYYYPKENQWLDMIVFNIKMLSSIYTGETLKKKQALAFHSLFQACISKRPFNLFHRKNLYLRTADVDRTFGNKRTWDIDFSVAFRKFALETSSRVFSNKKANKAYCKDVTQLRNINYDLVYLDPPYQRPSEPHPKDYLSMYHFLEGLVDYDNWAQKIDLSKKHKPLQGIPTKLDGLSALERLEKIVEKFQSSMIAVSYGAPGVPTVAELKTLLKKYHNNVEVFDTEFSYKLNKKNGSKLREILVMGY